MAELCHLAVLLRRSSLLTWHWWSNSLVLSCSDFESRPAGKQPAAPAAAGKKRKQQQPEKSDGTQEKAAKTQKSTAGAAGGSSKGVKGVTGGCLLLLCT